MHSRKEEESFQQGAGQAWPGEGQMALWLICCHKLQAVANPHCSKCWLCVSAMCLSGSCYEQVKEKEQSLQFWFPQCLLQNRAF